MAELAVIMSMVGVTSTALSMLGVIKRRCGACQTISDLAAKCSDLVQKIQRLLKTLEGDAQVPRSTRRISTALALRREEFDVVLKNLENMKRRTKSANYADRTEKFIKAQGWAHSMERIYSDLVHVRNGVENIVSGWDIAQFLATKVEEIVTVDLTRKRESGRMEQHMEYELVESATVNYVDRYQITMLKLTDASKEALNQYGHLGMLSLPNALNEASTRVYFTDKASCIQLMQRSAELLHPQANYWLGIEHKYGDRMKQDLNLAVSHFEAAGSRGHIYSIFQLIAHYNQENDAQKVVKYLKVASELGLQRGEWTQRDYSSTGHNLLKGELGQHLIGMSHSHITVLRSLAHFFGVGAPKSTRKAVNVLREFDFASYSVQLDVCNPNCLYIRPNHYRWEYRTTVMRDYLDFLFESKQFLSFFTMSHNSDVYSPQQWEIYALYAANNHCFDAHVFLAEYYSSFDHRDEHKMKRHLRIAADGGHAQVQTVCRQLFGKNSNVSKGLNPADGSSNGNEWKGRRRSYSKMS